MKARVLGWVIPHGICDRESLAVGLFLTVSRFYSVVIILSGIHTHVSRGGLTIDPLVATVQRHNFTLST
jgi:hypothetical protein